MPVPKSFALTTVTFKTYSVEEADGRWLWEAVAGKLPTSEREASEIIDPFSEISEKDQSRYGEPILVRPRLGQGAFRILVTDTYRRRCAISGERTLPALDAAHIRPFADGGPHKISNGVLMRRDIHSLFDLGYVTISPDLKFEVSKKIREEYENGRHYYSLHGADIQLPDDTRQWPDRSALKWHNEYRYKG